MYIFPNSDIYILQNVPLDVTYEHTIYFDYRINQTNYFTGKAKYKLTEQSYQRAISGALRVSVAADDLYDCNYLMFRNTSYGSRWFYGFIQSVNYINDNTSEIIYIIDPLQTWHFDYKLSTCFIERQHTETDGYGEHIIDEGLETGEIVNTSYQRENGWDDYSICVITSFNADLVISDNTYVASTGGYWSRIYSGLDITAFPLDGGGAPSASSGDISSKLDLFLTRVTEAGRTSSVIGLFMCPTFMVQSKIATISGKTADRPTSRNVDVRIPYGDSFSYANRNGSYKPKNNKLYSYPYSSLMVTNGDGDCKSYKWENFYPFSNSSGNRTVTFNEVFMFNAAPSAASVPVYYNMDGFYRYETTDVDTEASKYGMIANYDEALFMNDFPTCAYSVDAYRAWLAQKKAMLPYEIGSQYLANTPLRYSANTAMNNAAAAQTPAFTGRQSYTSASKSLAPYTGAAIGPSGVASAGLGIAAAGASVVGAGLAAGGATLLLNTAGFVLDQMAQFKQAQFLPEGTNGQINGGGFSTAMRCKRFTYIVRQVRAEYAEAIDNFFTMFGYKVNRVGVPNRAARTRWTYVKTTNCQITGSIPADDARFICDIYNHGITWWRNAAEIGKYDLSNDPMGG